ncbi:MAG: molecular chaperone GrpE [Pseudonocardiales bacterium]|nr:molecular chaperone GrpE [Pseudonocardiales bacterium]
MCAAPSPESPPDALRGESGQTSTELEDRWRRAPADLDNLRRRHAHEIAAARTAEREHGASAFLPVLDDLDRALEHADADQAAVAAGVRAVRDQAQAVLVRLGHPRQDEAGVPFDPARHEVVSVVPPADGTARGTVVAVLRPGYGAPGRLLRPASVTVADAARA